MIRAYKNSDLNDIMELWLNTNMQAHSFIPKEYWTGNYDMVKKMLPEAELYVYEDDTKGGIEGFIGLAENYIAGIFVKADVQSRGIGKQLLDHVKMCRPVLSLNVYRKNKRAVRFYQREQFRIHSESVEEDTGENELRMVWQRQNGGEKGSAGMKRCAGAAGKE